MNSLLDYAQEFVIDGKIIFVNGSVTHYQINDARDLYRLYGTDIIYEKNRPIDEKHVIDILSYQEDYYQKNGHYNIQNIIFGVINNTCPALLDGNHRYKAISGLEYPVKMVIEVHNFVSETERFEEFRIINQNTPLPDYYKSSDHSLKEISKIVAKKIKSLYQDSFSKSKNCHRPNMHKTTLREHLFKSLQTEVPEEIVITLQRDEKFRQTFIKNTIKNIEKYNKKLSKKLASDFPRYSGSAKTRYSSYNKCSNCYLGMYRDYEWVSKIIRRQLKASEKNLI